MFILFPIVVVIAFACGYALGRMDGDQFDDFF